MVQGGGPTGAKGGGAVFRRIPEIYYKPGLAIPVQPEAFRPTDKDVDGISVADAAKATPQQALLGVAPEKRDRYYVARIPIEILQHLGLSVADKPLPENPAHAVIPEMNTADYQKDKEAWKEKQVVLAEIASANIVLTPPKPK
jgi:hypothetical protein